MNWVSFFFESVFSPFFLFDMFPCLVECNAISNCMYTARCGQVERVDVFVFE